MPHRVVGNHLWVQNRGQALAGVYFAENWKGDWTLSIIHASRDATRVMNPWFTREWTGIRNYRNVRGLGKSMVVFPFVWKTKIFKWKINYILESLPRIEVFGGGKWQNGSSKNITQNREFVWIGRQAKKYKIKTAHWSQRRMWPKLNKTE